MSGVLSSVDQRTKLVGENRLELLLFHLVGPQTFAINVFKVQEVIQLSNLTVMPHKHYCVCGVTTIRNRTVPVINLSQAIGMPPLPVSNDATLIVTEYNRSVQAFLVGGVQRIVNMNWEQIEPPPKTAGRAHYLTAVTKHEKKLVEVIDVEKVLSEIAPYSTDISSDVMDEEAMSKVGDRFVLVVDDSPVAITQAKGTIEKLGLEVAVAENGQQALNMIKYWEEKDPDTFNRLLMVLTDAEMPEMDGYRLVTEIRQSPGLCNLHVVLHTSLSGNFNQAMVKKVGCDNFLSKFQPDELAKVVLDRVKQAEDQ